ncbi:MAG: hypothetical protein ACREGA_00605 [Candidatus Saccharimonadales bacterium]
MDDDLIIHPATRAHLLSAANNPAQAIALIAPSGFGKSSLARFLAAQILNLEDRQLPNYAYLKIIQPDPKIGYVEQVRELEHFFKLKTPGQCAIRRVAIVHHAEKLSHSAQSALLKTLEEPPADSVIIVTISAEQAVLATVLSRLQRITLRPPARQKLAEFFTKYNLTAADYQRILALGGGLPGRTYALVNGGGALDWQANLTLARQIIAAPLAQKLYLIDAAAKGSEQALNVARLIITIADAGLAAAAARQDLTNLKRWLNILKAAAKAAQSLQSRAQPKLAITNMMLQI